MNAMQPPQSVEEVKATLETTEKGGVRQSIRNCLTVFQRDPVLAGAIAYNILTDRKDIIKPIGFHRESTALNDTDMKYLLLYLEETYLVIDRNDKGENTVHFMNLVDESDLLSLMEEDAADAYTAEKEAAAQAEQERKQAEEDAKKAAEEAAASGTEQTGGNKVTKYAATFLGVLALVGLAAGGGIYTFMKQKQKKQAEKEALDPDANYTEDKGNFEIPVEDEPEETGEEDKAEE